MTEKKTLHFIGCDGEQLVDSVATQQQVDKLKTLECVLETDDGEPLEWADFDNRDEPQTVFQFIQNDRRQRIDRQAAMTNPPPIGVATIVDGACIRFEFYEGYRTLKKTHDLRSTELHGVELKDSIEFIEGIVAGAT